LIDNTTASNVGAFVNSSTNFGSAKVFSGGGKKLTFPATEICRMVSWAIAVVMVPIGVVGTATLAAFHEHPPWIFLSQV